MSELNDKVIEGAAKLDKDTVEKHRDLYELETDACKNMSALTLEEFAYCEENEIDTCEVVKERNMLL